MPRKTFVNKITSEKLTKKINKENIKLVERFLKEKSSRASNTTIVVYRSNMDIFLTWNLLHNNNKFFVDIKKIEFADFFTYAVEEMKIGSARLNNLRSVLSSFSNFIERFFDEDYPNFRNVILRVVESAPKEERREKTILTDEQIEGLMLHLKETDTQKACWLALAVCSGARFAELLRFETTHIDINRTAFGDLFLETTKQIKTKGRGKTGKLLYKYILRDKFMPYYLAWVGERQKIMSEKGKTHDFMFIKSNGEPLSQSAVRGWLEGFEKFLGVPFYPHSVRHFLVTMLSKKNIPPILIKELMGWSSAQMVEVYDDTTARDRNYPELDFLKGNI